MGHLDVGDRLPPVELPAAQGRIGLHSQPRRNLALLLLPQDRTAWRDFLEDFRRAAPDLREWYGRPVLVLSGAMASEDASSVGTGPGVLTAADPERKLERLLGVEPDQAVLLVADRWEEIYHLSRARSIEDLPGMGEVEEWLKYLATQCPECGVPDESGHGEWSRIEGSAGAGA